MVSKGVEVTIDNSVVEMRSICIQAQPPKKVKRPHRNNISKHSIGVGSGKVDETTIYSDLTNSQIKKMQQIKMGNLNKKLIIKRFQSEEFDRQK
jgi:hypothetical protein